MTQFANTYMHPVSYLDYIEWYSIEIISLQNKIQGPLLLTWINFDHSMDK